MLDACGAEPASLLKTVLLRTGSFASGEAHSISVSDMASSCAEVSTAALACYEQLILINKQAGCARL